MEKSYKRIINWLKGIDEKKTSDSFSLKQRKLGEGLDFSNIFHTCFDIVYNSLRRKLIYSGCI